jgi:hypothetical protein
VVLREYESDPADDSCISSSISAYTYVPADDRMAYGMGRPAILREDESIHQCRRLLEHPLSITSDARLVSTVELTALRGERDPEHR